MYCAAVMWLPPVPCFACLQDADRVGAEFLGMAVIPVKEIISGQPFDQWLNLVDKAGAPISCYDRATKKQVQSRLHISITFRPVGVKVGVCMWWCVCGGDEESGSNKRG